jgi:hypothetical protein
LEHVVQDEREPLRRSQRLKDHKQRQTDRVGQEGFLLRVDLVLGAHDRIGQAHLQGLLSAGRAGVQHVEAHPGDHRRQPSPEVLDAARVGAAEPQPRFLDGVVRLGD